MTQTAIFKEKVLFIGHDSGDTSTIFVGSLSEALGENYHVYFLPMLAVNEESIRLSDYCIFSRCFHPRSLYLMQYAKRLKKPVLYMLDDDLLGLYHLGPEYAYCAPGTPVFSGINNHIQLADVVITFSSVVTLAITNINQNVVEINPNILKRYLNQNSCSVRNGNEPLRIIFAGSAGKQQILASIWPAVQRFSQGMGSRMEFHCWGVDINRFSPLLSPVFCQSTVSNYSEYIGKLSAGGFHIFLAPLDDTLRCQKAKCCIKYLEGTAAGGVGIYSDSYPYINIVDGMNGIKTSNTIDGWFNALNRAAHLTTEQRKEMWRRAKEDVLDKFTTEVQIDKFVYALSLAKHYSSL